VDLSRPPRGVLGNTRAHVRRRRRSPGRSLSRECHARLEEVGYAEVKHRSNDVKRLFLKHEVIDWARHFPILNGLDGRSPILPLIKLQAILQWSRNYELQYLNPQNDQQLPPDKFLVAYGKNVRGRACGPSLSEEEQKNPWEEGRLMYEGNPDDVEIDILDLSTSAGINGREPMVERLMSQIRAMFGVSDAFENELSDAGGLNAEGTQVEITNGAVASAHQDTQDKALDTLCVSSAHRARRRSLRLGTRVRRPRE